MYVARRCRPPRLTLLVQLATAKLGIILSVKGYRYFGRYGTTHEAVMVKGTKGTARFGGEQQPSSFQPESASEPRKQSVFRGHVQ